MSMWVDAIFVLVVVTDLLLLASSRIGFCIRLVAVQGALMGLLPLILHQAELTPQVLVISLAGISLKLLVFPGLLFRAMRDGNVRREVEPFVGYSFSLLAGVGMLIVSFWIGSRLPLTIPSLWPSVLSMAFFNIFVGLFVLASRKKALTQVLGYLVLENGIYIFGAGLALEAPLLVELAILLDVFMLVFILGIIIFHISRDFEHLDMDRLSSLKDWPGGEENDLPVSTASAEES
ncbi:hydrogenase [bacterium]|nr:hydrogenase [bacterium]